MLTPVLDILCGVVTSGAEGSAVSQLCSRVGIVAGTQALGYRW